jgi:hypothetical protein
MGKEEIILCVTATLNFLSLGISLQATSPRRGNRLIFQKQQFNFPPTSTVSFWHKLIKKNENDFYFLDAAYLPLARLRTVPQIKPSPVLALEITL